MYEPTSFLFLPLMPEAVEFGCRPAKYPLPRMEHDSTMNPIVSVEHLTGMVIVTGSRKGLETMSKASDTGAGVKMVSSGNFRPIAKRNCQELGVGVSRSFIPSLKRACRAVLMQLLSRSK